MGIGAMKVATWNVNGIRARAAQLLEWQGREQPDVICLQELKAELAQIPEQCMLAGYHAFWHARKGYSGVALQLRREMFPAEPVFGHPAFDFESRIVQAELGDLIIASVYVPNGGKDYQAKLDFLARLAEWVTQLKAEGRQLILCGDINIARTDQDVHPKERKLEVIGQRAEERALFDVLMGGWLTDTGRAAAPDNAHLFTWWAPWRDLRARNIGWRIDYILTSPGIASRMKGCVVQAEVGTSDHAPVVLTTV
jgi:exodeoxyribonuclease III